MQWSHGRKLYNIAAHLETVIEKHEPEQIVREKGVTRFNKATQAIFRVVGVVDALVWELYNSQCDEVGITEAKKLITGSGRAEKEQVATAVMQYLTAPVEFAVDDESDAVAVGVAYCLKQEEQ